MLNPIKKLDPETVYNNKNICTKLNEVITVVNLLIQSKEPTIYGQPQTAGEVKLSKEKAK